MSSEVADNNGCEESTGDEYYYIDKNQHYETLKPSLRTDVIRDYGLLELAESVARTNPDGTKGVKLRKSYKSHIADLPGKYTIPKGTTLSPIICVPDNPDMIQPEIKPFEIERLKRLFNFEKSSVNGIPGFDASKLAIGSSDFSDKNRKRMSSPDERSDLKRRHVRVKFD
ncbi:hypothetical protein BRETT_002006 [Brettanomyces bruxellensis]|uniref:Mediator of RNA polymerase II transcription subunit 19 n=1 Tax=Dekkera bruxellensis TaxID=5007 RepID=A0A871RFT6_DEKBR|nr:uncharacterized protein BRETT_002006 [Brettanomyces bruxellensis]QOU21842.1 hypothetical protein BRETT_002006 [Brettanomyces bruxellensis]